MKTEELKEYLKKNYGYSGNTIKIKNGEEINIYLSSIYKVKSGQIYTQIELAWEAYQENVKSRYLLLTGNAEDRSKKTENYNIPESLKDYIISIEPFTMKDDGTTTTFTIPRGKDDAFEKLEGYSKNHRDVGIYKTTVDGTPQFNLVMIRVRENGNFVTKYMDAYLASSDSRTFHDVKYTVAQFESPTDKREQPKATGNWPHNLLIFGAPGTGKSYCIQEKIDELGWNEHMRRVTFYEDYSYEKFVGAYLPCAGEKKSMITGNNGSEVNVESVTKNSIEYRFEPGVFLQMIADAWFDQEGRYVLVIEEINRANAASVFGDFFQLLDRRSDGVSEYTIALPRDMRAWLHEYLWEKGTARYSDENLDNFAEHLDYWLDNFTLPGNLYLWATMNSADQGVYPMDSAFKRRWSYLYRSTQEKRNEWICIKWKKDGVVGNKWISWDVLKTAINTVMEQGNNIEEDRFVGPWFFKSTEIAEINAFTQAADGDERGSMPDPLTNKLFQYLRQDVFRNNPDVIFHSSYTAMSKIRYGMINGCGLNEILKIGDLRIDAADESGHVEPKLISELLQDRKPEPTGDAPQDDRADAKKATNAADEGAATDQSAE